MKYGHIFKDTYRVEEVLEGSKTAYKVSHVSLKTPYVVELMMDLTGVDNLEYDERQEKKKAFAALRERLETLAKNAVPGLARFVDSFEFEEKHYIVREWIDGLDLRKLVEQSLKPLDQKTSEDFGNQLLTVVETLNVCEPPLVLGTLCPDYIVVNSQGRATVIDYDLAERSDGKTEFEAFSCPELLGGSELDVRADLYSIGAILYFCMTGMELPPIWDRITLKDSISSPLELNVKATAAFWSTLESMLSLNLPARPQTVAEARALFANEDYEVTPEGSPATWYPEQSGLMLADSYPFAPIAQEDWVLKIVQAATIGRARHVAVTQTREACCFDFRLAAPDVPAPRDVVEALTTDAPISNPLVKELACGLRTVGEFRDFRITLDDWKQSWTLTCRGGSITSQAGETQGSSGLYLKVPYRGRSSDRARQSADELTRLVRKTRLCTVPITIGKKPLEPGRGVELSEMSSRVVELYLVSASLPEAGKSRIVSEPAKDSGENKPFMVYEPQEGSDKYSHIDVRCYVQPGEGKISGPLHTGYSFLRRRSRVLWYRRGVLCGEQYLDKNLPLQLDIHINGDHLEVDNSGLKLVLPDWLQASRLRPVLELSRILPVTKMKLEEHWAENPGEAAPKTQGLAGAVGAPLFLLFLANLVSPGLLFLKTAKVLAMAKGAAAAGGTAGYFTAGDHYEAMRKTCLKAIDAFGKEEI